MKTIGMKDRNFFIIVRGLLLMLLLMGLSGCKPEREDGKEESITSGEENRHPNYTVEFSAVPIKQNTALEYAVSCIYGNDLYYVGTKNQKSVIYQHNLTSGKESVYLALNQKLTIKGICFSKDGNLDLVHVLRNDISTQCVMEEFSAEGRILQHNIYTTQFLPAYIANGLARTNKGKYCIQVAMGAGKHGVAKLIDADHTVVKVYNRTCLPEDVIGIGYAINDEGVLLYDETGLYIYDGADNCEMLFRWSEVAILGENVRAVTQTEDEILALITDVSGKNAELARIRKWGEEREEKVLTLATVYASDIMKSLVSEYNSHKQGCQIKLIEYLDRNESTTQKDLQDAINRMADDILEGGVPDILDLSFFLTNASEPYVSVETLLEKGYVMDLTPYAQKSKSVNLSDYEEKVLGMCSAGGKVAAIPVSYNLETLIANTDYVGEYDKWSISDYVAMIQEQQKIQGLEWRDRFQILDDCIAPNLSFYVKEDTGECHFDDETFRMVLRCAKVLLGEGLDTGVDSLMEREKGFVYHQEINNIWQFMNDQNLPFGKLSRFMGFPAFDGNPKVRIVMQSEICTMAICADCQYPEEAWHFMEVCFGTPFYRRQDNKLYYSSAPYRRAHGIPANHNVLEGYLPYLMEIHVIKQEDMDFLYEQLENAEPMTQRELYYMSIIKKEAKKYFEGQNDLEETIQEIQTQITSWIKKNNAR